MTRNNMGTSKQSDPAIMPGSPKLYAEREDIMKETTGIVRRIDDLGRIVIPKEMRQTLRIKEGDSLEISINGEVILIRRAEAAQST